MIELFAKWASDSCNRVTKGRETRLQKYINKTTKVTNVTVVTAKEQKSRAEGLDGGKPRIERRSNNFAVTTVTSVTSSKSLNNSCNQDEGPSVTRLQPIPVLSPAECDEVAAWPPPTQKVFVAVLKHLEGKGLSLAHAEPLAYATMQVLMQRRRGLIGFAKSGVPDEVAELLEPIKDVFGDAVEVEWRPDHAPGDAEQPEQHAALVRCCDCQNFERGQGDRTNALGLCHGQPWDGHDGQWPKAEHRCLSYKCPEQSS